MGFLIDAVTRSVFARRGRPGMRRNTALALLTDVVEYLAEIIVRIYDNTGSMQACC